MKRTESYYSFELDVAAEYLQYMGDYRHNGLIKVKLLKVWEKSMVDILKTWTHTPGIASNPDINSGNPFGWGRWSMAHTKVFDHLLRIYSQSRLRACKVSPMLRLHVLPSKTKEPLAWIQLTERDF
jgi:hypothetical protein